MAKPERFDEDSARERFLRDKPGSPEAVNRGCTCFPAENRFGAGRWQPRGEQPEFTVDADCPLHGIDTLIEMLD